MIDQKKNGVLYTDPGHNIARFRAFVHGLKTRKGFIFVKHSSYVIKKHRSRIAFHCERVLREWNKEAIAESIREGIPVVIVECGFFKRGSKVFPQGYYHLSLNSIGNKTITERPSDGKRWLRLRLPILNETGDCTRHAESNIVTILGQVPDDAQHGYTRDQLISVYKSLSRAAKNKLGKDVIVEFRPHPSAIRKNLELNSFIEKTNLFPLSRFTSLEHALQNSKICLTYNSTCAYDAVRLGVPFFVKDEQCSCKKFSSMSIKVAPFEARQEFLWRVADSQFTEAELKTGQPQVDFIKRISSITK